VARRVLAVAFVAVLVACDSGGGEKAATSSTTGRSSTTTPSLEPGASTTEPAPAPGPDLAAVRLSVRKVAGIQQPTAMAVRAGDDAIYATEKAGRVRRI